MAASPLKTALDELFSAAPADFMSTRDALAAKLRASGNKDDAAVLKAQHKPTRAAFALNALARTHATELEALFAASRVLASGKSFKAALDRQRAAFEALRAKISGPDTNALVQVVRGAMVDTALADRVRAGHFSKLPEVELGFFGAPPESEPSSAANDDHDEAEASEISVEPAKPRREKKADRTADAAAKVKTAKLKEERAKAVREKAEREEAKRHARKIETAERNLERLTAEADETEKLAKRARAAADSAAETLTALRNER